MSAKIDVLVAGKKFQPIAFFHPKHTPGTEAHRPRAPDGHRLSRLCVAMPRRLHEPIRADAGRSGPMRAGSWRQCTPSRLIACEPSIEDPSRAGRTSKAYREPTCTDVDRRGAGRPSRGHRGWPPVDNSAEAGHHDFEGFARCAKRPRGLRLVQRRV